MTYDMQHGSTQRATADDPNFQPLGILVGLHDLWLLFGRCFIDVPWSVQRSKECRERERER